MFVYSFILSHGQLSILEPKGTLGTVIMSDNASAKVVTVWPWHYMLNLHFAFCKVDAISNKLLVLLELHSSSRFQYRLLTMTTFLEIVVNKTHYIPLIILRISASNVLKMFLSTVVIQFHLYNQTGSTNTGKNAIQ